MRTAIGFVFLLAIALGAPVRDEPYRPQFHFSPERNWTNDPCGLIYVNGEYHLFFQFNPSANVWGHMTWGHAVSRDLVHWKELPPAIPESGGVMIFTGSSVQQGKRIVSIYTGHRGRQNGQPGRQHQNLAFSEDARTWTRFDGNPVLDTGQEDFRDPKVFWHAGTRRWIMLVMLPKEYKAQFFASSRLKEWTHLSDFGPAGATSGIWECPDLYELPVDGDRKKTKWVLKVGINPGHVAGGSGEQYFVGRFDGTRFINDNPMDTILWTDHGRDCYCEFSFTDAPHSLAPVALGWMSNWQYAAKTPTSPWRGQMTIPRKLSLETTPQGIRLVQTPAPALNALRGARVTDLSKLGETYEIAAALDPNRPFRMKLAGAELGYNPRRNEIYVDRREGNLPVDASFPSRTAAPLSLSGGPLTLRIFVDRSSIEVFGDRGRVTLTNLLYPSEPFPPTIVEGRAQRIDAWPLRTVWATPRQPAAR